MSSEDDDLMDGDAPDAFSKTNDHTPPAPSQATYINAYQAFQKWNKSNGWSAISEDLLMQYFAALETKKKPSTLVAIFSMLKATFRLNDNIDINTYSKLIEFVKEKNADYTPASTVLFTDEEIDKFLNEAVDDVWLDVKVFCVFAVSGLCNTKKLINLLVEHVKRYEDLILVTIPKTSVYRGQTQSTFTITGTFFNIVQKYADLRHEHPASNRFFLCYHDALSLRRNPAKSYINSNAWNQIVEQPVERVDLDYQTGHLKTSSFSYTRPPASTQTVRNANYNSNDDQSGHTCTLSCGQVKCASEENEESVLHAFTTMKPAEFVITDLTPAVFPANPACRWIVAYTHHVDAVTASYADETFEDITRSIPNNVRINQRYIRGNTTHLPAAYVVVYGVNCKCQKETQDIFNFAVNEVKFEV